MTTSEARMNNFETIGEHYRHKLALKKRGKNSAQEQASLRTLAKELTAAKAAEKTCQDRLKHVRNAPGGTDFVPSTTQYQFKGTVRSRRYKS